MTELIPTKKIKPNPRQPRKDFNSDELKDLAESIRAHGLINPVCVEKSKDEFILIDGERRWRAAQLIGLTHIEASIREDQTDDNRLTLAIVGNMQRKNMNPIETAQAIKNLIDDTGCNQREIASKLNISPEQVCRYLQFLTFPQEIQELYKTGQLKNESNGQRALLKIEDRNLQIQVAQAAAKRGLSGPSIATLVSRMRLGKTHPVKTAIEIKPAVWNKHWNMIAQSGEKIKHEKIITAAESVCQECALYDVASSKTCRECPGAMLLCKIGDQI